MKNKKIIWYGGYVAAALVILIIAVTDLPEAADAGLAILFAILFSVSHVTLWHDKMMEKDRDYRIEVMDERNIAIKEKAGNVTNMINLTLLGVITVIFILMDYIIPAIFTGVLVAVQPVILILVSNSIGKKM
ncbi:MAG TPA: hypothetical protein H9934_02880 [Candidatus Anaerobutyricum faecale]|nr:hypothetical protein [Candidatus Anaerobutyricum faecale]